MSKIARLITALGGFSIGLLLPVMNLILLGKGATLETLPLLLGCFSITVMIFELPSGILADLFGRKTIFLIGCGLKFLSLLFLLITVHPLFLLLFVVLNGLSRAFSSGSLDALFIEEAIRHNGDSILSKVTSHISILNGVGLALGGVAGGFLASLLGSNSAVILICLFLYLLLFILALFFTKETRVPSCEKIEMPSLKKIMEEISSLPQPKSLFYVFSGLFFSGFFLFAVEAYWQSAFGTISGTANKSWMLGIISFFGFVSTAIGNLVTGRLLFRFPNKWWRIFRLSRILFAIVIFILAMQASVSGFILLYALVYLCLGTTSVAEDSIINQQIPNRLRSSFLSFGSLLLQIGGLFSSVFSSLFIRQFQIQGLWLLGGTLILAYAAAGAFFLSNERNLSET